tara:strand:- start:111 stop:506 length:396 start_codon:yes stop_codon:yes gene_type:complete
MSCGLGNTASHLESRKETIMANSARNQVETPVTMALPEMVGTGKSTSGKVTFDTVPAGVRLPKQMIKIITTYYAIAGDAHRMVDIQDIVDALSDWGYAQDAAVVMTHYKMQIEGRKEWKGQTGIVKLGSFE